MNLVVCCPSGTGKAHFCEALGHAAIDAGHKVSWFSLAALGTLVRRHGHDDTTARGRPRRVNVNASHKRVSLAVHPPPTQGVHDQSPKPSTAQERSPPFVESLA